MLAKALAYGISGVSGFPVNVEVNIASGMPQLSIIGLPDASVKESSDRLSAAFANSGYVLPIAKIIVNLTPADVKKIGPAYDLAMAIAILMASGQLPCEDVSDVLLTGGVSLDGTLQPVKGALPIVISAHENGVRQVILPEGNAEEVACLQGMNIYPAKSLREVVMHLTGKQSIPPQKQKDYNELVGESKFDVDMSQIQGQLGARRALEVAAAGGHNMLMLGTPGSGKTMLARCLPSILPPLTFEEAMETTKIHSIAGVLPPGSGLMVNRPFRSPHHTSSDVAMIGGGSDAKPGEISLAHNGVLFLDELPEFPRKTVEALRQPLEDGFVSVTRVHAQSRYQSNIMLVASMNPCPCGYYGSKTRQCRCTQKSIRQYLDRISGPLLDRIDIQIEVDAVPVKDINSAKPAESSATVRERVCRARKIQQERYKADGIFCNSQLSGDLIGKYCHLDDDSTQLMNMAIERTHMSMRGYKRIVKVARTIADLAEKENIGCDHVAEAIQYRELDQKYWR